MIEINPASIFMAAMLSIMALMATYLLARALWRESLEPAVKRFINRRKASKEAEPMKKNGEVLRQGDVILIEVDHEDLLSDVQVRPLDTRDGLVLAYGEITGHAHRVHGMATFLSDGDMSDADIEKFANTGEKPAKLYLAVDNDNVALKHEEHAPIGLGKDKVYEVRRQREYDKTEGIRYVAD